MDLMLLPTFSFPLYFCLYHSQSQTHTFTHRQQDYDGKRAILKIPIVCTLSVTKFLGSLVLNLYFIIVPQPVTIAFLCLYKMHVCNQLCDTNDLKFAYKLVRLGNEVKINISACPEYLISLASTLPFNLHSPCMKSVLVLSLLITL